MTDAKKKQRARLYKRGMTHLQVEIDSQTRETFEQIEKALTFRRKVSKLRTSKTVKGQVGLIDV